MHNNPIQTDKIEAQSEAAQLYFPVMRGVKSCKGLQCLIIPMRVIFNRGFKPCQFIV